MGQSHVCGPGRPNQDSLTEMIRKYSNLEDVEILSDPHYVCRTISGQSTTVSVNMTCIGDPALCSIVNPDRDPENMVAILYDLTCEDNAWFITDMEIIDPNNGAEHYDNCSYCLTDDKRREMFPSTPTNTYQFISDSHCLCKFTTSFLACYILFLIAHAH